MHAMMRSFTVLKTEVPGLFVDVITGNSPRNDPYHTGP